MENLEDNHTITIPLRNVSRHSYSKVNGYTTTACVPHGGPGDGTKYMNRIGTPWNIHGYMIR